MGTHCILNTLKLRFQAISLIIRGKHIAFSQIIRGKQTELVPYIPTLKLCIADYLIIPYELSVVHFISLYS